MDTYEIINVCVETMHSSLLVEKIMGSILNLVYFTFSSFSTVIINTQFVWEGV